MRKKFKSLKKLNHSKYLINQDETTKIVHKNSKEIVQIAQADEERNKDQDKDQGNDDKSNKIEKKPETESRKIVVLDPETRKTESTIEIARKEKIKTVPIRSLRSIRRNIRKTDQDLKRDKWDRNVE